MFIQPVSVSISSFLHGSSEPASSPSFLTGQNHLGCELFLKISDYKLDSLLQGILLINKKQQHQSFTAGFQGSEMQNIFPDPHNSKIPCPIPHFLMETKHSALG